MAKAKRKDPVEVETPGVSAAPKRQKIVHEEKKNKSKNQKDQQSLVKSKKDGAVAPKNSEEVVTSASAPEALRIIIGSYEKVLCGIDAKFEDKSKKVYGFTDPYSVQNNLVLNPVYMFSAHTGAIKCLATNDRYLVSGGSDEVIKYPPRSHELTKNLRPEETKRLGFASPTQWSSDGSPILFSKSPPQCVGRRNDMYLAYPRLGMHGHDEGTQGTSQWPLCSSVGQDCRERWQGPGFAVMEFDDGAKGQC
jgi:hypothetical protein